MNKIVYNLVYNRRNKLRSNGTALIQVEASLKKQKKYFSTNVYLRPEQWDRKSRIIINHPNAEALNQMIYSYVTSIEEKELSLWRKGKNITLDAVANSLEKKCESDSFISFCYNELHHSTLKDSTKKNHLSTVNLLKSYQNDLNFLHINYDFVCAFDHFLQEKRYHLNTVAKHMKHLKKYINAAINKELIDLDQYPFRKYKIRSTENHSSYLSPEELHLLETIKLLGKDTKSLFKFCSIIFLLLQF